MIELRFSGQNGIKLEINNNKILGKPQIFGKQTPSPK